MAKEEQKQKGIYDEDEAYVEEQFAESKKRQEAKRREKAITASKENFAKKKEMLANRAAQFVMQYGKEDYRSQIMLTFLDVTLQMEDAINLITDVGTAMSCITEAIDCMDGILAVNELQVDGTLSRRYGLLERWKRRRKMRKAINNNAGRMMQICDTLVGNQKMAQAIVNSLKKSSMKMQAMMQKNAEKQRKKEIKMNPAAGTEPSRAELLVDEIVRTNADEGTGAPAAPAATAAPASGASSPRASDGTVDISDI